MRPTKKLFKIAGKYLLIPITRYYLRKERNYTYKGIRIKVKPGVFHPGLFFSTKMMAHFIEEMKLENVRFLELGAGTGLISILAAKKGAVVSASDISPIAIENLFLNANLNKVSIQIITSDLFDNFPQQKFDIISIQPPYYPRDPVSIEEFAWYCGKDFDFYRKLFRQIGSFIHPQSQILMILSDDCEIGKISEIAFNEGYDMIKVIEKKIFWEWNYIFMIKKRVNE